MPVKGNCPMCGHTEALPRCRSVSLRGEIWDFVSCCRCRSVYLWPPPDTASLARAYDESYYGEQEHKFSFPFLEVLLDTFRRKRALMIRRCAGGRGKVLDIGCGNGRMLHFLHGMGTYEIFGTELPGSSARRAAGIPELKLYTGSFAEADYPPESFDAISLFHVFEHLEHAGEVLKRINTLLKPGGCLLISFPNADSIQAKLAGGNWLHYDPPRHLCLPDHKALVKFMEGRSYRLLRRTFLSPEQNPFGAIQSLLNLMCKRRDLLLEMLKGNKTYSGPANRIRFIFHLIFLLLHLPLAMLADLTESAWGKGATVFMIFKKN